MNDFIKNVKEVMTQPLFTKAPAVLDSSVPVTDTPDSAEPLVVEQADLPLGVLGAKLDKMIGLLEYAQNRRTKVDNVTVYNQGYVFSSYGFRYFGIYVNSPQVISVEINRLVYNINLRTGYNSLNVLENSNITSATAFPCSFVWSDVQFKSDMVTDYFQLASTVSTQYTANIALGTSLAPFIDLAGYTVLGFHMPAAWDAANLTFQVSEDGVTYNDLYDNTGIEKTTVVAASRYVIENPTDWIGVRFVKVRSGTAATPVNQTAARAIVLVTKAV